MLELVATAIITASSILLFGYWFRYTCLLILSAKTTRDYAFAVATANQLGFLEVQSQLHQDVPQVDRLPQLDRLRDSLDRDYGVLAYLLENASNAAIGDGLEKRMIEINYRVMRAWYSVSRRFSPAAATRAIEEMSMIVAHFANSIGESAAAAA